MPIIPSIVNWLNNKRISQIELFKKFPQETQDEVLYKLLVKASGTEWGRRYDFSSISSAREFQNRLPVLTYEEFTPVVERLRKGESNLVWPGETRWFAKSSGTTSTKSKFIPLSRESLEDCHYRGARDMVVVYAHNYPETIFSRAKA